MIEDTSGVDLFISLTALIGFLFGMFQIFQLKKVPVGEESDGKGSARSTEYLHSLIGTKITVQ
jgi:hypothetical protein